MNRVLKFWVCLVVSVLISPLPAFASQLTTYTAAFTEVKLVESFDAETESPGKGNPLDGVDWIHERVPYVAFRAYSDPADPDASFYDSGLPLAGFAYNVDRSALTTPVVPYAGMSPPMALRTVPFQYTLPPEKWDMTDFWPVLYEETGMPGLDILGWEQLGAYGFWMPGMYYPYEGPWALHAKSVGAWAGSEASASGVTSHYYFGLDVTPPRGLDNFQAADGTASVIPRAVRTFIWDNPCSTSLVATGYDELSGDSRWAVWVNGTRQNPPEDANNDGIWTSDFTNTLWAPYASLTISSFHPGMNTLEVACVDFAGNIGPRTSYSFYSDTDTPTISILTPASAGATLGLTPFFSVDATDRAGIQRVTFSIDSTGIATMTAPPFDYRATLSTAAYAEGAHTFRATVTDLYNRSVTATRGFVLDYDADAPPDPSKLYQETTITVTGQGVDGLGVADTDVMHPLAWYSGLYPEMSFLTTAPVNGFAYCLDHTTGTLPVMPSPGATGTAYASAASLPATTGSAAQVLLPGGARGVDIPGWGTFVTPVWGPGVSHSLEGTWYAHARAVRDGKYSTASQQTFGIDITEPLPVTNLQATDGATGTVTFSRRTLVWDNPSYTGASYDALSGDWMYYVEINGVPAQTGQSPAGLIPVMPAFPYASISVEDLAAGVNTISVSAVDRAGNKSLPTDYVFTSDPDTPTVSITDPLTNGQTLGASHTFRADASDSAGIAQVEFFVDGGPVGVDTSAPYEATADMSAMLDGLYTVDAVATDMLGRTVTASKTFNLVKYPPPVPFTADTMIIPTFDTSPYGNSPTDTANPVMWVKDLAPIFRFDASEQVNGFAYSFDHASGTLPVMPTPGVTGNAYVSAATGSLTTSLGTSAEVLIPGVGPGVDLLGWSQYVAPAWLPGMTDPVEGYWYAHSRAVKDGDYGSAAEWQFAVDITPPASVTGLDYTDSYGAVIPTARRDVLWDNRSFAGASYDAFSGDWLYYVELNGVPIGTNSNVPGAVPVQPAFQYGSVSLEDLPAGSNTIGVGVIDRAGNLGSLVTTTFSSDPDMPTVVITRPSLSETVGVPAFFSAEASDEGGITLVEFRVDGSLVGADSMAPYELTYDMLPFASGTRMLSVTAYDLYGRAVTANQFFTFDKLALPPPDPSTLPVVTTIDHSFVGQDWAGNRTIPTGDATTDAADPYLWTNDLHPEFTFSVPSDRSVNGFVYGVDHVAGSVPQLPLPGLANAYVSAASALATYGITAQIAQPSGDWGLDMRGWQALVAPAWLPGMTDPVEGLWWMHVRGYRDGEYGQLAEFPWGVDITDPGPITGLTHADSVAGTLTVSRRDYLWNNPSFTGGDYDALSGDWAYYIELNGEPIDTDFDIAGALPVVKSALWGAYSIEDIPPGINTVGFGVIDRAGNLGSLVTTVVVSDYDTPTVAITAPGSAVDTITTTVTVSAQDAAGIHRVDIGIDGVRLASDFSAPYELAVDLTGYADGLHSVEATAYDLKGRVATASSAFTLTKYSPFDPEIHTHVWYEMPDGLSSAPTDTVNWFPWVSDLYPDYSFESSPAVNGFAYVFDHSAFTLPWIPMPGAPGYAYVSAASLPATRGTEAFILQPSGHPGVDLRGWSAWSPPVWLPGMTDPVEGVWFSHAAAILDGVYSPTDHRVFGVDVTDPDPVSNLQGSDSFGASVPMNRRDIVWDNPSFAGGAYDALSGDWMYYVEVNGEALRNNTATPGIVPIQPTHPWGTVSIEDLESGPNTVSVGVVDRAGNIGPLTDLAFVCDPDTPTVGIQMPSPGETIAVSPEFSVVAWDTGAIVTVAYFVDGAGVGTATAAPWALTADLTAFPDGPHVLTVVVTDSFGRTATATVPFTLFKFPPPPPPAPFDAQVQPHGTFEPPDGFDHAMPDETNPIEWISDLFPDMSFESTRDVNGFVYSLDHSATTVPTMPAPGVPGNAYVSAASQTATVGKSATILQPSGSPGLDMPGWSLFTVPSWLPGMTESVEGIWYLHARTMLDGQFGPTMSAPFGIDITDPLPVTGLGASDAYTTVVPMNRRDIVWDNPMGTGGSYDALSGDWMYYVEVNGVAVKTGSTPDGLVPALRTHAYGSISIEDFRAGENTVSVGVVDRAGNLGPLSHLAFFTDAATPTVSITRPASVGETIGVPAKFSATASDDTGIVSVEFRVGGTILGTDSVEPYEITSDMAAFADGPQVLSATARDRWGRAVTASRAFILDKTAPPPVDPSTLLINTTIRAAYEGAQGIAPAAADTANPVEWTNDLYPDVSFDTTRGVHGFAYVIDRTAGTIPQLTVPGLRNAYVAASSIEGSIGTNASVLMPSGYPGVDLPGWNSYWPPAPWPGAVDPVEGMWYVHTRSYLNGEYGQLAEYPIGIDITPPSIVTSLAPADSVVGTVTVSRRDFTWRNPSFLGSSYDALSGDWLYRVTLNGEPIDTGNEVPGTVPVLPSHGYGLVSVEDFPEGVNVVGVSVIDRAGNIGPEATYTFVRDSATPTVDVTHPVAGETVTATALFSADASDAAGIHRVEFRVDGTLIGTDFTAPYELTASLAAFADGARTVTARAYDLYGRSVTDTDTFTLVKNPPLAALTRLEGTFVNPDGVGHADPDADNPIEWINDLYPDFRFSSVDAMGSQFAVNGFAYSVDHAFGTLPVLPAPGVTGNAYVSAASLPATVGSMASVLLPSGQPGVDLPGWSTYVPPVWLPGMTQAVEGIWVLHGRAVLDGRYGPLSEGTFGVDVTDPLRVTGLRASDIITPTIPYARRDIVWNNPTFTGGSYDALSGDWMYYVKVNGQPLANGSRPGLVPIMPTHPYGAVSVEDLPPGENVIEVGVVDRAGNIGPLTPMTFWSDPDTPTVEIVEPSGAATVGAMTRFSANATDAGGIASMTFRVDASVVATFADGPFVYAANLSAFADGPHTLFVTVVDHYGRTVTVSRAFVLDKSTAPPPDPSTLTIGTEIDVAFAPPDGFGQAATDINHPLEWTSDRYPDVSYSTTRPVNGFVYAADHVFGTVPAMPVPGVPGRAYVSAASLPATTGMDANVLMPSGFPGMDLPGWGSYVAPVWLPGMSDPSEGLWVVHARAVMSGEYGLLSERPFGLDITDPGPITNLRATDSLGSTITVARRDFVWDNPSFFGGSYDALSGDWMYYVEVNGEPMKTNSKPDGVVPVMPNFPYGAVSIEDCPAGRVTIAVGVIDRAGNLGPLTGMTFYSDPDTPTVDITSPAIDGETMTVSPRLSADATDRAGITRVDFSIDSTFVASDIYPPYVIQPDLSVNYAPGLHTLTVRAYDQLGRMAIDSRQFYLDIDATPPPPPGTQDVYTMIHGTYVGADGFDHAGPDAANPIEWINDLYPDISFECTQDVNGFVYAIDHAPGTLPQLPVPGLVGNAYVSAAALPATTGLTASVLLPSGQPGVDIPGWGTYTIPSWIPGMHDPLEGVWYVHARALQHGLYGIPEDLPFGIDVTDPRPVTGLRASDAGGAVIQTSRRDFIWNNPTFTGASYDELSRDWMYYVELNGEPIDTGNDILGMVPIIATHAYGIVSIEDLPVGRNTVSVGVIDRAGNLGPLTSMVFYSDPDVPTVKITAPAADNAYVSQSYKFSATASDGAGIARVEFRVDGILIGADTASPYEITKDMSAFANGNHTLTVTAYDLYGRTAVATRPFILDKTPPTISSISDTPDPFYPVIREGYKDNMTVTFRTSEAGTAYLNIFTASGTLWRQVKKTVAAGVNTIVWDGKSTAGGVSTGTFYYRVGVYDAARNASWSAKYPTTIRNYELVPVSGGGVKVVPR